MENVDDFLKQHLREQIGMEEHLCSIIENQISEIDETDFSDAKSLLINTKEVLEKQFDPLNKMLDKLEKDTEIVRAKAVAGNGAGNTKLSGDAEQIKKRISSILRDDYSALNLITMSNTLLHTIALALNCQDIAETALKHLQNLAPLVVKIGELLPDVVTRELRTGSAKIDLAVAKIALQNAQLAWRNAL